MSRTIVLIHTMDPRGSKLGGIETHVRLMLARHPPDVRMLFVGLDEFGDLAPGVPVTIECDGRPVTFLPVARVGASRINTAAKTIAQSTTLRFALGLVRRSPALRRAVRGTLASAEIERFEFALVPKLIGLPLVVLVHNEGTRKDAMDSILKKYWFVHRASERIALSLADGVFAVNASIARHIEGLSRAYGRKTGILSVSVDTERFVPTPFSAADDAFHVCFAGRLDDFKDPPLMFQTLARLSRRLDANPVGRFRRVVFDYVGATDPERFPAFAAIARFTVRHGIRGAAEVAAIMARAHAGLVTSFFEGMPCYLLEMLASGRPVVAVALPQFRQVVIAGRSGALVERREAPDASAEALADELAALAGLVEAGAIDPLSVASLAAPFSVEAQMGRLFACHAAIARSI